MHGSTAQRQPECSPFHRGAVDFFELAELLACRPIREQAGHAIAVCSVCQYEACSRSVTGAVDNRRLAQRCALRRARGYEVHESRQSREQSRRRRWLSLRARAFVADLFLYIDMWGLSRDVVAPERVWIHRALASFK